uniref:Uncharacterized protein n=1 Tax=Strigamia maritima TaxID=126957 RepID=T1IMD8_STRMM
MLRCGTSIFDLGDADRQVTLICALSPVFIVSLCLVIERYGEITVSSVVVCLGTVLPDPVGPNLVTTKKVNRLVSCCQEEEEAAQQPLFRQRSCMPVHGRFTGHVPTLLSEMYNLAVRRKLPSAIKLVNGNLSFMLKPRSKVKQLHCHNDIYEMI